MWAAHQMHHSSEDYNLTTALRQSVLQSYSSWVCSNFFKVFFHLLYLSYCWCWKFLCMGNASEYTVQFISLNWFFILQRWFISSYIIMTPWSICCLCCLLSDILSTSCAGYATTSIPGSYTIQSALSVLDSHWGMYIHVYWLPISDF